MIKIGIQTGPAAASVQTILHLERSEATLRIFWQLLYSRLRAGIPPLAVYGPKSSYFPRCNTNIPAWERPETATSGFNRCESPYGHYGV